MSKEKKPKIYTTYSWNTWMQILEDISKWLLTWSNAIQMFSSRQINDAQKTIAQLLTEKDKLLKMDTECMHIVEWLLSILQISIEQIQWYQHKVWMYRDLVIKQKNRLKKFDRLTRRDPLTKVWNRTNLEIFFNKFVELNQKDEKKIFSLALIDIDNFGRFNKEHWMDVGDAVLSNIAQALKKYFVINNIKAYVFRIWWEEFVVLWLISKEILCKELEKFKTRYKTQKLRATKQDTQETITWISVNFSWWVDQYKIWDSIETLRARCDAQLRKAKENWKNQLRLCA